MAVAANTNLRSFIDPTLTYALKGFMECSGISYKRMQLAKRAGLTCPTYSIGRRKFIDGKDAISYLRELAKLHERSQINTKSTKVTAE